jgi:hypothetical protein
MQKWNSRFGNLKPIVGPAQYATLVMADSHCGVVKDKRLTSAAPSKIRFPRSVAMKRCPLCDFIYEDEQSLCDMDGMELVADSGLLTRLENTATVPAELAQPTSSWGRRFAFPTVATLILGSVLFLVYYLPTHRSVRQELSPAVEAMTTASPTDSPQSSTAPESEKTNAQAEDNTSQSENLAPSPSPSPKRAEKKRKTATEQPVGANRKNEFRYREYADEKKDSRIGSILKKTGRILKKPFEF